ncbi:hypothetical protein B0H16DRAFT_1524414 [Mycena metata]|uniref:Uncharacterized protein n=1 Tax=Mycena metata TaxID=1033252 RepID=A0AAD7NL58_9AGAR|nr:hypothetical protein B0H16DRAFT_1524414 [Mycena metata]
MARVIFIHSSHHSPKIQALEMSESATSSETLSIRHSFSLPNVKSNTMPYELIDSILGHTIGQIIHDTVEITQRDSLAKSLRLCWNDIRILAGVSTTFRAITLKLVALAFRIPLPCESRSIFPEASKELRSLLLFKAATCAGAVMDPPAWDAPLLRAYGYHLRAKFIPQRAAHSSVVSLRGHRSEIQRALGLCNGTLEALSYPLVNALQDQLQEADVE